MAEPTVFEMEIEGVVHPIEDRTARQTVEKLTTYSTTEQDTGKIWTNGKKIYRRVIQETLTNYSDSQAGRRAFNLELSMPDGAEAINISGTIRMRPFQAQEFNKASLGFVWFGPGMEPLFASGLFQQPGNKFYISVATATAIGITAVDVDATIEYTKSE